MIKFLIGLIIALNLTGCVGAFVAGAVSTANVTNDIRTTNEILQDNNLELEIIGLNNKSPYKNKMRINAYVNQSNVFLIGQASNIDLHDRLISQVQSMSGGKKVHDQIRIKTPINIAQISNDTWITTKVKSALLTEKKLSSIKIKVLTEDSEVFLFGRLTKTQADAAAQITSNISGVTQVIKAIDIIN